MLSSSVPRSVSAEIIALCRRISENNPVWVEVLPESFAIVHECFPNVQEKVSRAGGRIQYGWTIWECRPILVEAEHHAVYEAASGRPWIDITPHIPAVNRILFLPDDAAVYDFSTTNVRDNIRIATVQDPLVDELLRLYSARIRILNRVPSVGKVTLKGIDAIEMDHVQRDLVSLQLELSRKYSNPSGRRVGRNDPCPCGSGQKYKKCCGR